MQILLETATFFLFLQKRAKEAEGAITPFLLSISLLLLIYGLLGFEGMGERKAIEVRGDGAGLVRPARPPPTTGLGR